MYCIYQNDICFWWNPKCGCSFIKRLFRYLFDKKLYMGQELHINTQNVYKPFMKNLTHILFIRNPYHRFVSNFIQTYIKKWGGDDIRLTNGIAEDRLQYLTFKYFVNTVLKNKKLLRREWFVNDHFRPQITNYNKQFNFTRIFDLYNIDYDYLSNRFHKEIKIPTINYLRETGMNHVNIQNDYYKEPVYDYTINTFKDIKIIPKYKYFYNDDLKQKVREIYKEDFDFFESNGFKFDV